MKQAVVFLLDASSSMMNTDFGESDDSDPHVGSRCKNCLDLVGDMIQELRAESGENECCVIVLKSAETVHHKSDSQGNGSNGPAFSNLQEFPSTGLTPVHSRARASYLIKRKIFAALSKDSGAPKNENSVPGGDFIQGLILASDSLQKTVDDEQRDSSSNDDWKRSIILISDVEGYNVSLRMSEISACMDSLSKMNCSVSVVGINFPEAPPPSHESTDSDADSAASMSLSGDGNQTDEQVDDEESGSSAQLASGNVHGNTHDSPSGEDDSESDFSEEDDDEEDAVVEYLTVQDRQRLVCSIVSNTNGVVWRCSNKDDFSQVEITRSGVSQVPESVMLPQNDLNLEAMGMDEDQTDLAIAENRHPEQNLGAENASQLDHQDEPDHHSDFDHSNPSGPDFSLPGAISQLNQQQAAALASSLQQYQQYLVTNYPQYLLQQQQQQTNSLPNVQEEGQVIASQSAVAPAGWMDDVQMDAGYDDSLPPQ